ncbi:hypothetical protein PpBr36_05386 [Pyricularia pennisetigena]|uniref:hypothetical protein n=1 Tax=Pyricularia pennisetigena TaxID=1578925 RepID=UPI00115090AA|nr:hypothetical protein PpBr36_05386 [Pyricularia pennisetigena]TLS26708.1 hypothetical protein PpBr36_05386 [Pyricularia pennisetigena]
MGRLASALLLGLAFFTADSAAAEQRSRESLNAGWRFTRFTSNPDGLTYSSLKPFIMPAANDFVVDLAKHVQRPDQGSEPAPPEFSKAEFDDAAWEAVNLPHDWAVKGPFYEGPNPTVGGGQGRLPSQGIGWYRRNLDFAPEDAGKAIYIEVDGAMSYSTVWLNGRIVGGWPYGYASYRLELTPFLKEGKNQLAIRVDSPINVSRWYPGGGVYRNVWLTKVNPTHVGHWGTYIKTKDVSSGSATVDLAVTVESTSKQESQVIVSTDVYVLDASGQPGAKVASFGNATVTVPAGSSSSTNGTVTVSNPALWGPKPDQTPNLHVAVTSVYSTDGELLDTYKTKFGIRSVQYTNEGLHVNGKRVYLQGVCQHHDLGSLGSAFHVPAARRQLEMLQDMGTNAVRTSHNPPAPELLELADHMGMLVLDEIFDTWANHKVDNDFATIWDDWSEPDLRAFVRRDRNHASVWAWSYGNEVREQTIEGGERTAQRLAGIAHEEDATRSSTVGMNNAGPNSPFTAVVDLIGLNYQGEGKTGSRPSFPNFRSNFPNKMIYSSESSSAVSSRGTYVFPVPSENSAVVNITTGAGVINDTRQVSSYELHAVSWGASPDKVFAGQDEFPYVGGEFVWTGWDYIGEPTPYDDESRSSYFGIIDLAGFPKDRFYLYQARWAAAKPMAHILPHWNWAGREGQVTPVHVFSSGDEAELFVNGESQGRKKRGQYEYRFRWDEVTYAPGEVHVATYKGGAPWANATVRTAGAASTLSLTSYKDQKTLQADGSDLAFLSVAVTDDQGDVVPTAEPEVTFSVSGPGEIVSTDNGDPTDFVPFPSHTRKAFRAKALAIVRAKEGGGRIVVTAEADGLKKGEFVFNA